MEVGFEIFEDTKDSFSEGSGSSGGGSSLFLSFFLFFSVVGEFEESLNFVLGEEVAVGLEFLRDALDVVLGHFSEFEAVSVSDVTGNILLEEFDDIEGFGVLLD